MGKAARKHSLVSGISQLTKRKGEAKGKKSVWIGVAAAGTAKARANFNQGKFKKAWGKRKKSFHRADEGKAARGRRASRKGRGAKAGIGPRESHGGH